MKTILNFLLFWSIIVCSFSNFSFSQNVALNFDGTNDFVQTTFGGVTGSADRTFEAWVYVSTTAPATNLCILDYGTNAAGSRNTFAISGTRKLTFTSGGTNANIGSTNINVITAGQWTHVAFVLDAGTGFLYVNGVQVGTGPLSSVNTPVGNQDLTIGERVAGGSILFDGAIDEVRVYDYARTVTQINADMNAEYCTIPTGLLAYYRLNDGVANGANATNNSALDDSGSSNSGTLTNFALTGTISNWVTGPVVTPGISSSSISINTCGPYTSGNGTVYSSSGTFYETYMNSAGCDSIVELQLFISPITNSINASVCDTYLSPAGNTYTGSGLYYDTLQTAGGCDSIISISLTIDNYSGTEIVSGCGSYTTPDGANTWMTSGQYPVTYTNTAGCDSVVTYNLTIESSTSSTISEVSCSSYTAPSGTNTYTSSGIYTDVITNSVGCDSTITINLTIVDLNNGVTQNGFTLTADLSGASYQWYTCDNDNGTLDLLISGETGQSFTPIATGEYGVEVAENGCTVQSACYLIDLSGIEDLDLNIAKIFPNPSDGNFEITFSSIQNDVDLRIINLQGKEIIKKNIQSSNVILINEKNLPTGVYFVRLETDDNIITRKIIIL